MINTKNRRMRLTSAHKSSRQRQMEASSRCRLTLHNGHRDDLSDSPRLNAACKHTMSGDFRYPQRRLDRCHLPSHPSYSDMIHHALPPPSNRDWRSHITNAEFHLNPQPQWTKQKRGSGAACNDSCIKRISRLAQPANAWRTRSFTIIYNRRARWQSSTLVPRTARYHSLMSWAGISNKHPCVDEQAPKITHGWKCVVATDHSSCDSNFG